MQRTIGKSFALIESSSVTPFKPATFLPHLTLLYYTDDSLARSSCGKKKKVQWLSLIIGQYFACEQLAP